MKNQSALLMKHWRIWITALTIILTSMACIGGSETSAPPVEPRTEAPVQPKQTEQPTEELPTEAPPQTEPKELTEEPPTEAPATEPPPAPTTGTISGVVELSGITTDPLAATIVEIAGWEDTYWAETNAQGEYNITEVPPGVQMVIPRTNSGLTSYQAVNVIAGEVAVANFRILSAWPLIKASTIEATITVDGVPTSGAYLWLARTNQVYRSNQSGNLSFVYGSATGQPAIVVYNDRWDILKVPFTEEKWNIELSRVGNPPRLPDNMAVIEERQPIILDIILPTPPRLLVLPGLRTQEDCIGFEGSKAALENVDGRWKIVVGMIWLLDFGDNQQEAQQALKIIQYYGFNQQCFIGRPDPSMEYYLMDGNSPSGPLTGEDCIQFNPGAINVENVGGRWKITEGSNWLMDFNDQEAEARNAYNIIQKYTFKYYCFVGRPDPSLTYFRQ